MEKKRNVLLITGATKGIGRAITDCAITHGWEVVGIARTPDTSFPGVLKLVDLLDPVARRNMFQEIIQEFQVTRLVNNAGTNRRKPFVEVTEDDFDTIMELNTKVPFELTQMVLPDMLKNKHGRIVNIASRAMLGRTLSSVYSTSKSAIVGFTRTLALEVAEHGVTVNTVSPGHIDTEFSYMPPESLSAKELVASIPMKRLGLAQEVAGAACYFLRDDASYTTGQNLFVCGGVGVGKSWI
jgi:NAD(P)-dependent dehydrogenase (short-subunit alcohol dehydrogenase family)